MFGFFGGEKAALDHTSSDTPISPIVVKTALGTEMSFAPNDAAGFDKWAAKITADNTPIQTGLDGDSQPIFSYPNSPAGKAELIKTDLMVKHGLSADAASKAVKAAGLNPTPQKPILIFKKPPMDGDKAGAAKAPPPKAVPVVK